MKLAQGIEELKKSKERKFNESVEVIVNLRKFDSKKSQINTFITLPNKIKDKKICGFIESKNSLIDTIPKTQYPVYKDKKKTKVLVKKYDFFIALAPNMPAVATTFGRTLGPAGKMPSPKLGILMEDSEKNVKELVERIEKTIRIQAKEPSIKAAIGKINMDKNMLNENISSAFSGIVNELPLGKENVRSIIIKTTMGKPIKVEID